MRSSEMGLGGRTASISGAAGAGSEAVCEDCDQASRGAARQSTIRAVGARTAMRQPPGTFGLHKNVKPGKKLQDFHNSVLPCQTISSMKNDCVRIRRPMVASNSARRSSFVISVELLKK